MRRITIPTLIDVTKVNKRTVTVNKRISITEDTVVSQTIDSTGKVDKNRCLISNEKIGEYIVPLSFEDTNKLIEDNSSTIKGLMK
jgi:hypothetical protein